MRHDLDPFDRAILTIVQKDNQLSHAEIAEQVGLSASAVRRRLIALRETRLIQRDVAILEQNAFGVTLIVHVYFKNETPELYDAFERQMQSLDRVRQCYSVAGECDFVLIVFAPSLEEYERWAKTELMAHDHIRRYDTTVVWSCKKFETALPMDG